MLYGKTIAVVVPAYNEETQIGMVIESMPDFVDRIVVVNDGSKDETESVVMRYIARLGSCGKIANIEHISIPETLYNRADTVLQQMRREEEALYPKHSIYNDNEDDRLVLITEENSGVGSAIAVGYKWCRAHRIDCTAVMAGDGQMDPAELEGIVAPVCNEAVDYVKGNRLSHPAARYIVPQIRYFGNNILSLLTKIASGYWKISDTQTGYTAISFSALNRLPLYAIYHSYGCPNDILVKLNIENCSIREIPIKPVYAIGEASKMRVFKVVPRISALLFKCFFKRIWMKYLVNSFHPLFLFYTSGFLLSLINVGFFIRIIIAVFMKGGTVPIGIYMAFMLLALFSFLCIGFGMWMDMQDNASLNR